MDAIYIAGATASGKSAVALELAERIGGEIISVDSMQVYRGLDIGTAKPTAAERARVPHHAIDVVEVTDNFDVAQFLSTARQVETEIRSREQVPIYCGGTGLYFNALNSGIGNAPPVDSLLRVQLEATPLDVLVNELTEKDPETFAKIDRSNPRRVIRAIEVIRTTGRPFSPQRANWETKAAGHWFGLERSRDELNARINARVDQMFAAGLVDETTELLKQGLELNRTAMQAIGYRQVVEHLCGERDLPSTIELIKQKTRQFAKRQGTWFRNQLELNWIAVGRGSSAKEIAEEILRRIGEH